MLCNIYPNKRGPPQFFHLDTNPIIGHALVHSVDKTYVLVVTVDLIWLLFLNILSFNFVATLRKSLRFTRIIRSYAVVLTNNYQSYVYCSRLPCSIFLKCLFPMIVYLRCWTHLLLEQMGRQTNRCEIVINISNLTVGELSIPSTAEQHFLLISIQ